jgi:glycosyltransferase involved in cell wall biosynthesis
VIRGLKVGVLVPAYNEERLILKTLEGVPPSVERVLVVDDGSTDRTAELLASVKDPRVSVIRHERNRGLGQALATGYRRALDEPHVDVWVVMAGDNQMDPGDLDALVAPIAEGRAQYVKGNRLFHPGVWRIMPAYRLFGNSALTLLTKFATGYFHLLDPQCGYTAIHREAIRCFDLERPHRGYGYNAHLLMQLNLYNVAVADVPVRPVYGEAQSKIRLASYVPTVAWLLLRCFARRIFVKYVVRDFHPIGLVYLALTALAPIALYSGSVLAYHRLSRFSSPLSLEMLPSLLLFVLTALASLILFLFAIWMDIEYTRSRDQWRGFGSAG